ncbi:MULTISPECIES: hypothetical protein [Streptomyces]|uniref:Uncharacterized protein n=1 Tax=Streptomyces solicathayae TaxID=3081768 RepID=A0ABZ0M4R3_9ACTN|nr:hypothetical protein [Streptomyces sp. HUAS YS2]WOX26658.1 hypothetical protein R2D22_16495 [Streptomyces sp. HUAS YS2]
MAFGADELRVLRRALASALCPTPLDHEDVQDCLRLADALDEAVREAGRLRAFLLADLGRYRATLPGSAPGYLELLQDALAAGYDPRPEDLAALRSLRERPVAAALLERCAVLAERSLRTRLAKAAPAPRTRLLALPGGRAAEEKPKPGRPAPKPDERPVPKPSEVFPPRRRPVPPPPPEERAAG